MNQLYAKLDHRTADGIVCKIHNHNDKKIAEIRSHNPNQSIQLAADNFEITASYQALFNLIFRRYIKITAKNELFTVHGNINNQDRGTLNITDVCCAQGDILAKYMISNNIIHIISIRPNIRFNPLGFTIATNDRIKSTYDIKNKIFRLQTSNLDCIAKPNHIEAKIYSDRLRGSVNIKYNNHNIHVKSTILTAELTEDCVKSIAELIQKVNKFYNLFKFKDAASRNIIINAKIKKLQWNKHCMGNICTRMQLNDHKIKELTMSARTSGDNILLMFLNKKDEIEVYSTNAQDILNIFSQNNIFTGGTLQGIIDTNTLEWRLILMNSDMQILTTQILFATLTAVRGRMQSNTFMPLANANGHYNKDLHELAFNFIAENSVNIIKANGMVNFRKLILDINIAFATKALLLKMLSKFFSIQNNNAIPTLELHLYGDIKHPSYSKPIINALISQVFNFILF